MSDLEVAIAKAQQVVDTTPLDHPDRAGRLSNLGVLLGSRFSRIGEISDLENAIVAAQEAVNATPDDHPDRARHLSNLGNRLGDRYSRMGDMKDLERSLAMVQQVLNIIPFDHPNRAMYLNNLGILLGNRYWSLGEMTDLEKAVAIAQEAVDATPVGHPNRPMYLNYLGNWLDSRYSRLGDMSDLEKAIAAAQEAVDATPPNHPERARRLNGLGNHLGSRFSRTGNMADLDKGVAAAQEAVNATPLNHPDRAMYLNNLGIRLCDRFSRVGEMADLDKAVATGQQVVDVTPLDHPDRPMYLSNLGNMFGDRYARTGNMTDLGKAVAIAQEAVDATPLDHPDLAGRLNNLANQLGDRYSRLGEMAALDKAVATAEKAVDATPLDHPDRAGHLSNLSVLLNKRYLRVGEMADLEKAVTTAQEAVDATPSDHPDRPMYLNNLGKRLGDRYLRMEEISDLETAIATAQEAVNGTPLDYPNQAGHLNNLGTLLGERYSRLGEISDLEAAIATMRETVDATPLEYSDRAGRLNNLGMLLGSKYSRLGELSDLENAIVITQETVDTTPPDHPTRAGSLNNLGNLLGYRYSRVGEESDSESSQKCHLEALHHASSPIQDRIIAGRQLLSSSAILGDQADQKRRQRAYEIAQASVQLVPLLTPRSLQNTDKEHLISQAAGITSDAAAIALQVGKDTAVVLEMLETGRCVLAAGLYDTRTSLSDLHQQYPELAQSFIDRRDKLDTPYSYAYGNGTTDSSAVASGYAEVGQRREEAKRLDLLIQEIRSHSGFERFLLPASETQVREAASNGPIVMINISRHRCDALLIEPDSISILELPHLSPSDLESKNPNSLETLGWLWDTIVCPILDRLGFTETPNDCQWPHVWWIPTGPLVGFPLHAAGYHLEQNLNTALDRVISSYGSSIRSIIHGRQQRRRTDTDGGNIVLVAMEDTPNQSLLPYATAEIGAVQSVCQSMQLPIVQPKAQKSDVLSALSSCRLFHFAGHGSAPLRSPLQGTLLLKDWIDDPLTVDSVLKTNLTSDPPFFAYLSACGTSEVRNEELIDEAIHLTAAYQLAGFRHVIGTLWSVSDKVCVEMAKLTYESLRESGIADDTVSQGLHMASRTMRDNWVKDEVDEQGMLQTLTETRDGELFASAEEKAPLWVPYVHYGC
ncbi:CHAT domain-containing protein [Xylaria intraflava]|nr:CHAT domain-containing protein [Xylaria intraflava]